MNIKINLLNNEKDFSGIEIGIANLDSGYCSEGIRCGFLNDAKRLKGIQFATLNISEILQGIQIGVFNCVGRGHYPSDEKFRGLQIGLYNAVGEDNKGLQIGAVNYRTGGKWYSRVLPIIAIRTGKKELSDKIVEEKTGK